MLKITKRNPKTKICGFHNCIILFSIKQKNTSAIITAGQNVGSIGKITNIKEATFSRKSMIDLDVSGTVLEVPANFTILVGDGSPAIKLE